MPSPVGDAELKTGFLLLGADELAGELRYLHKRLICGRMCCSLLEQNGDPAMSRKGLSSCGWEAQGRLPGSGGIPQAFAEKGGFEPVEVGTGEGRADQRRQHIGSGLGVREDTRRVQSSSARERGSEGLSHTQAGC